MADPTSAAPAAGLRERKKRETRKRISQAALVLFDRQGFERTTIPEIAASADVSPRTVSTYFPTKEMLAFPDYGESFQRLGQRLDARPEGEMTADALRDWIVTEMPDWDSRDDLLRVQRRVIAASEALIAYEQHLRSESQLLIARSIARDLGRSPDDLEPRMAAAATMATFDVLGEHYDVDDEVLREPDSERRRSEALALLERALMFVGAGITALQGPVSSSF